MRQRSMVATLALLLGAGAAQVAAGSARLVPTRDGTALERLQQRVSDSGGSLQLRLERRRGRGECRLAGWRLRLRGPAARLAGWLEDLLAAGVVFGPPLVWQAHGEEGLEAAAWSLEPGCPLRAENRGTLERLFSWMSRRRDDCRVLGPLLAGLVDSEVVAWERLELARRRLLLRGRAASAPAAAALRRRLAVELEKLSFPVRVEYGGLASPPPGVWPAAADIVLGEVPAWLALSAAAWLTGRAVIIAAAPGRLSPGGVRAEDDAWLEVLARRAGWSVVSMGKLGLLAPRLQPGPRDEPAPLPEAPGPPVELMLTGVPAEQLVAVIAERTGRKLNLPGLAGRRLTAYLPGVPVEYIGRALAQLAGVRPGTETAAIRTWDAPVGWRERPLHRLRLAATFSGARGQAALFADDGGGYLLVRRGALLGRRCGRLLRVRPGRVELGLECPGRLDPATLVLEIDAGRRSSAREVRAGELGK